MHPTDLPDQKCPACDTVINAATEIKGREAAPKPGDLTLCFECGNPLVLNHQLKLRRLTRRELEDMDPIVRAELMNARVKLSHFNALMGES